MKMARKTRILTIIAIALTVAAVVAVGVIIAIKTNEQRQRQEDYEFATQHLRREKTELMSEHSRLLNEYIDAVGVKSTLSFAFIDLSPLLYDTVFPLFEGEATPDDDIDGIMCLDTENIPGMEGRISRAQYDEMLDAGWGEALFYNGDVALLEGWLNEMEGLLRDSEISLLNIAVFGEGSNYTSAVDPLLLEYGITVAVHYEADEFPLLEVTEGKGGVWHPGVCGWLTNKLTNRMYNLLLRDGGHFFFTVGFDEVDRAYSYDPENSTCVSQFERMAMRIRDSLELNELRIYSDLSEALKYRAEYNDLAEDAAVRAEAEKAAIQTRIKEIENEILDIFNQYFG